MADSCLTDAEPINPINQLLVDLFGDNYFPPYAASGQPPKQTEMANDKLLQWALPGGGKFKPPGNPQLSSIADLIAPMTGMLGQFFTFLGPLFIIIDVIRGIIDVICALLNPIPLIAAVIQLLTVIVPPLIALFPPFAMILMAINICKLIVSIIVSMLSVLIPLIELIVQNALSIADLLAPPNFNIAAVDGVTLKICTLLQHLDNQIGAFTPISFILELFDLFAALAAAFFCAPGNACCDSNSCPPFVINPPTGSAKVLSVFDAEPIIGILTEPIADLLGISSTTSIELTSATSSANPYGLLSSKGIGSTYTTPELLAGAKYVIDPNKIAIPGDDGPSNGPATPYSLAFRMTRNNQTFTARIKKLTTSTSNPNRVMVEVDRADFDVDDTMTYTIIPDMPSLLSLNMIGLGCVNEVSVASQGLVNQTNADVAATAVTNNGSTVNSGLSSLRDKVGSDLPRPPISDLEDIADKIATDPTTDVSEEMKNVLLDYLDQVTDYYDSVLCIGASRLKSDFSINKTTITSDGYDSAVLSLTVKDQGGNPLLNGLLPNSSATVEFYTTLGTVGPVVLDDVTGTYQATLTSNENGDAEISAAFIINDKACMMPGTFDGFTVSDKILRVNFIPPEESFARRRPVNQYVQSGRGKRR
jgi:hypothetical protein